MYAQVVGEGNQRMTVGGHDASEETMALRVVGALRDEIVTMALKP